jgi:hypothetical protein
MPATLKPLPERLALLPEIDLKASSHSPPSPDCKHPEGCDREIASWVLGQEWTDHPEWESPVLAAFRRRLNDALPEDLRQRLKESMFDGIGTAGDGRDEDRAWMITDWSIRIALPTWLERAGVEMAPAQLRALPEVTAQTFADVRPLVVKLCDEAWERHTAWREKVREAVSQELRKRGVKSAAVADAAAAAAAAAVAVAAAAAAAAADAAAVAVAVAAAVADAAADADAAAAAAAAADAAAAAARPGVYSAVYQKVRPIYEEKIREKYRPTQTALLDSALDLIKRMSSLEPSRRSQP